jgi:hypothetical protein
VDRVTILGEAKIASLRDLYVFTATVVLCMVLRTMFVAAAEPSARSCSVNVIGKNDVGLCEANRTRLEVATTSLVYTDR